MGSSKSCLMNTRQVIREYVEPMCEDFCGSLIPTGERRMGPNGGGGKVRTRTEKPKNLVIRPTCAGMMLFLATHNGRLSDLQKN